MLQQINTIEEYDKIRTELHIEWNRIIDYQMKMAVVYGLSWVLCTNCNAEFENTLRSIKEKEQIISKIWDEKFSFEAIIRGIIKPLEKR